MRLIAFAAALTLAATTAASAPKPKVPAGLDPGGVTVALVGNGIDYTRPTISHRLARDGEGEIVGWNFVDNDRLPFASSSGGSDEPTLAERLGEIRWLRLIPLRIAEEDPASLASAIGYAARAGARVVIVDPAIDAPAAFSVIEAATARFSHIAFMAGPPRSRAASVTGDLLLVGPGAGSDIAVGGVAANAAATMAAVLRELPSCMATRAAAVSHAKLRRFIASLETSAVARHRPDGSDPCSIRMLPP